MRFMCATSVRCVVWHQQYGQVSWIYRDRHDKTQTVFATGIDHIKDLGVTHVQILPSYDYATVDETKLDTPQFNWGYDPKNYNVPEGSYSTDPYHGKCASMK